MNYRREIDGLRALAVIPVVLFHTGFESFSGGFVGVDVFFVISGYLITSIILKEKEAGTFSLLYFYERRARRILPALFLVLAACLPFAWFWLLPSDLSAFSRSVAAVSVFASNILFWNEAGYFDTDAELKPLLHTWSLAVEEQFYIIFPLFILFAWGFGKARIALLLAVAAVASLAIAHWGAIDQPAATFYLLPTRGWELAMGALLAIYFSERDHFSNRPTFSEAGSTIGVLLILLPVFFYSEATPFPSLFALVPTLGTALIILFGTPATLVGRLLGSRPLVGIGLISYSIYLWHQPMFAFARHRSLDEPGMAIMLVLSAAAILPAYLSWRFVEQPFRQRRRIGRKSVLSFALAGSLAFLAIGLAGNARDGFPGRFDAEYIATVRTAIGQGFGQDACWQTITDNRSIRGACEIGHPATRKDFALLGDSHASTLTHSLDKATREHALSGLNLTYPTCPPLLASRPRNRDEQFTACAPLLREVFGSLEDAQLPEVLVVAARWALRMEQRRFNNLEGGVEHGTRSVWTSPETASLGYTEALARDFHQSIQALLDSGRTVILVYPIPEMGWHVPRRLLRIYARNRSIEPADASIDHAVFRNRTARTYEAFDRLGEHPKLVRIYPEEILCNAQVEGRCIAHHGGVPLYMDDDHLSDAGASLIVDEIMQHLPELAADDTRRLPWKNAH